MPVDTSMYGQLQQPQNPLTMAQDAIGLMGSLQQNKLLQQQVQGRQALMQAVGGATGPDGQVDYNKLQSTLSQGPGAYLVPEVQAQGLKNQQDQVALNTDKLKNIQAHLDIAMPAAVALLAKTGPDGKTPAQLSLDDVRSAVASVYTDPNYPQPLKNDFLASAIGKPGQGEPGFLTTLEQQVAQAKGDPFATNQIIRNSLTQMATRMQNTREQIGAIYGTPQAINTGGKTQIVSASPLNPDGMTVEGSLTNTVPPAAKIGVQPTYNNTTHQMEGVPLSEVYDDVGNVKRGYEKFATAPALGESEAFGAAGQGQGNMLAEDIQSARNWQDARPVFEQAISHAQTSKTGIGTEEVAAMKNFLGTFGIMSKDDLDKAGEREVLDKYLAQVQTMAPAWGAGTDLARQTAIKGSPNGEIPNKQLVDVLRIGEGMLAAKAARFRALKAEGATSDPTAYAGASADWASNVDPRAFVADKYSPQERAALWKSLTPDQQKTFAESLKTAHRLNFISIPNGQ